MLVPVPGAVAADTHSRVEPGDPGRLTAPLALRHLFDTFTATGSATACVKAFRNADLSFPWRQGTHKGELDWKPLQHQTVLRILHNPRYAGAFAYGRHRH